MYQIPLNRALLALALASTIPASVLAANLAYVAQPLTVAGSAGGVQPAGINADGVVVGTAAIPDASTGGVVFHAAIWAQGQIVDLGLGQGNAINALGHVAGSSPHAPGDDYATVWIGQKPTQLSPGVAYAINGNDEVVGEALGADGLKHPAVWRQGSLKLLSSLAGRATGINASGQIVGYTASNVNGSTVYSAVRWVQDAPTILSVNARAYGINDAGIVVGGPTVDYVSGPYYWTADNQAHSAPLSPGANDVTDFAVLNAINNNGMVVGMAGRAGAIGQITDHLSLLPGLAIKYPDLPFYSGSSLFQTYASSINDAGAIPIVNCTRSNCPGFVLEPKGPIACTVIGNVSPSLNNPFIFSGYITLLNLTQGDLVGWQVNETLKDPTIVYRMSQARIKVSNGGKLLTATPTTANQVISAGSSWSYNFGAAKFPATNPSITDLNATMGGQSCIWVN